MPKDIRFESCCELRTKLGGRHFRPRNFMSPYIPTTHIDVSQFERGRGEGPSPKIGGCAALAVVSVCAISAKCVGDRGEEYLTLVIVS